MATEEYSTGYEAGYEAGYEEGWNAATDLAAAQAEVERLTKELAGAEADNEGGFEMILTDDEIYGMYNEPRSDAEMVAFAREVEAAVLAKLAGDVEPVAWMPIDTAPKGRILLVHYKNRLGNGRTMRARYYLPDTLDSDTTESGWADEGWYEESEAYEYLMPLEGEPTHWMPLPQKPGLYTHPAPQPKEEPCGYDETTGNCTSNPCCHPAPKAEPVNQMLLVALKALLNDVGTANSMLGAVQARAAIAAAEQAPQGAKK